MRGQAIYSASKDKRQVAGTQPITSTLQIHAGAAQLAIANTDKWQTLRLISKVENFDNYTYSAART